MKINFRMYIQFDALVSSYQKMNGRVGIGLIGLKNIEIISKKNFN